MTMRAICLAAMKKQGLGGLVLPHLGLTADWKERVRTERRGRDGFLGECRYLLTRFVL